MANALYAKFKQACLEAGANLLTSNVKAVLVDTGDYAVDLAADEFLDDIPAGAREGITANLAGKTTTNGVFNANDIALPDDGGDQAEALVLYIDTGVEGTSRLVAYIDTAAGLPITPDSTEDSITWHASGIFAL